MSFTIAGQVVTVSSLQPALLDNSLLIKNEFIPELAISRVFVVTDAIARLALVVQSGDSAKQLDNGSFYIYDGSGWLALSTTASASIATLQDVQLLNLMNAQILRYDNVASKWKNIEFIIDEMTNVIITSVVNNQVLTYETPSNLWKNKTMNLNFLSDVVSSFPATGDILRYNSFNNAYLNSALTLDLLNDVIITAPVVKNSIFYNGSNFVNRLITLPDIQDVTLTALIANQYFGWTGGGVLTNRTIRINHLSTDFDVQTPTLNQTLIFDNSSNQFKNGTMQFTNLGGVSINTPTLNQVLTYNGTNWINQAGGGGGSTTLAGLTDVVITSPLVGELLQYSASLGKWFNGNLIDSRTNFSDNITPSKMFQFDLVNITAGNTRILNVPDASGTILLNDNTATVANKTLVNNNCFFADGSNVATRRIAFNTSAVTSTRIITWGDTDLNMGTVMTGSSTTVCTNKTINDATNVIGCSVLRLSNANPVTIFGGANGGYGDVFSLDTPTKMSCKPINLSYISDAKITDPQNDDTLKMQVTKNIYALGANAPIVYRVTSTDLRTSQTNVSISTGTPCLELAIFGGFVIGVVNTSFVIYRCRVSEMTSTNIPLIDIGSTSPGFTYNNFSSSCFSSNNSNCIVITGAEISTSIAWSYSLDYGSTWNSPIVLAGSVGSGDFPVIGGNQQYYGLQWSSYYQLFFVAEIKPLPRLWQSPDGRTWSRSVLHVTITGLVNNNPASIAINNSNGYLVVILGTKILYSADNITWTASVTTGLSGMAFCGKNNAYYALSGTTIYKSSNGVTWSPIVATTLGSSGVFFRSFEITGDCLLMNLSDTNRVIMGDDSILDIGSALHPNGYFFRNQGVFTLQTNTFINSPKVTNLFTPYSFTLTTLPVNPMTSTNFSPAVSYALATETVLYSTVMVQSGLFAIDISLSVQNIGPAGNVNHFQLYRNGARIGRNLRQGNVSNDLRTYFYTVTSALLTGETVELRARIVASGATTLTIFGIDVSDNLGSAVLFTKIAN